MKITFNRFFAAALAASLFFTACSNDDDNNNNTPALSGTDRSFMTQAALANEAEINLGQLALTNSSNDSVMMFAQHMVTEHTQTGASLDSIAGQYSVTLPTGLDSMHAALRTRLAGLSGRDFDTAYINSQIMDHQRAITLFQSEANNGSATNVRSFASRTLPHLQMHLALADSIAAGL